MAPPKLSRLSDVIALAVTGLLLVTMARTLDLVPTVESDFFFSEDDPQLQASNEIANRYSSNSAPQILIRARANDIRGNAHRSPNYL